MEDDGQRELQHRMKNMAAVIRCLARRSVATSDSLEEFEARFDGRVGALVRSHLARSRNEAAGPDLEEIIRDTLQEHAPGAGNWSVAGPEVQLPGSLGDILALLFHELAMESVLGGGLAAEGWSEPGGRLEVEWGVEPGDRPHLRLDWRETGLAVRQSGIGSRLARELLDTALPRQCQGQAEEAAGPDGLRLRLSIPLAEAG